MKCAATPGCRAIPAEIIGLRTKRYGPDTTSARGGSHGAKVPSPSPANSFRHATNRVTPMPMRAIPAATPSEAKNESGNASDTKKRRAIHSGTKIATVTGRTTTASTWRQIPITPPTIRQWLEICQPCAGGARLGSVRGSEGPPPEPLHPLRRARARGGVQLREVGVQVEDGRAGDRVEAAPAQSLRA